MTLTLGLIINPVAGLGGSVALKGSDDVADKALALGAEPLANKRAMQALTALQPYAQHIKIITVANQMGQSACQHLGLQHQVVYTPQSDNTTNEDTRAAAKLMLAQKVDVIVFAGGDGTARDICAVCETHGQNESLVLGIPAGCKIHSGVYAVTPNAAGKILAAMAKGEMTSVTEADVMDIDEQAFRRGVVKAKLFGDMNVPAELRYIQATKSGGKESPQLVLLDIADFVIEQMQADIHYVMGSGSTVAFIMEQLGVSNTLLGVDIVHQMQVKHADVTAKQLLDYAKQVGREHIRLVITAIGGQGHILGRGNQQLSAEFIRYIGKENIIIVATKSKLQALNGRPLLVDSGDELLDQQLQGLVKVTTGYNDFVMYPVGYED